MNAQGSQHQAMSNHQHHHQQQRPSYQQYQLQRRQQQQQQQQLLQQQQQQEQQQPHHLDNANNSQKLVKNGRNWLEADAKQQQSQRQQHLSSSTTIGATAIAVESTAIGSTAIVPANAKQSIAVPIPQLPFKQMNQAGIETVQNSANMQQITSTESIATAAIPSKMSRIPMVQQQQQPLSQPQQQKNFNKISKTAPHHLNDIYEKHLLSQTTFQEYELQHYPNRHQQQQHFLASSHMAGVDVRPLGVGDFNLNNYAGNVFMQPRQPQQHHQQQQQQHEQKLPQQHFFPQQQQQHSGRSQKPLHFLKLPPPPATPPQSTAAPSDASQMHFHYMQQQQQLQHHHSKQLPPPSSPPPPAPLNHVYETIAERPPMPAPTANQTGGNNADTIDTATPPPPPLPPSRQLRKRLAAIGTNAISASNGRSTKSSHKKGAGIVAAATAVTATAEASSSEHHNQRKHSMQKIGNNENFCFPIEDNQRQRHPLPSTPTVPPAYVAPPPAATAAANNAQQHKRQQQQQQQQHHHYNIQQRTKADGEHKTYVYQQLREHQQQQQQQEKLQQQQHEKQQQHHHHQNTKSGHVKREQQQQQISHLQHQSNMREVPLGAVNAGSSATKTNSNISTTPVAAISANVVHAKAQQNAVPPLALLSVEEQLHQAGLLRNNSQPSSGNMNLSNNNNIINMNNRSGLCSALPIVFEEEPTPPPALPSTQPTSTSSHGVNFKEMQPAAVVAAAVPVTAAPASINGGAVGVVATIGTAKLPYRHGKIEVSLETAQAMAAAAYYARAAQKLAQSGGNRSSTRSADMTSAMTRNGGFCGALQRAPPPMPPGLARRLANKENYGLGKVKVMLRVADTNTDADVPHFMTVDKKKRQVTLTDPTAPNSVAASTSQERGPMVAAPKMFAFDSLFTAEDQQSDVCSSALSEVIPAVLEGSDGCLLTIGYPSSGQSKTMLGSVNPPSDLGAIPCAISWLYKGINERRQKSGSRVSVRVSALGVSATKPDSSSKDLLAAHATESDDSPGVYLRDDFLGGPTELRAPTAERAALFLDAALAGRPQGGLEPAMIFTLHVYQYSLSRKGGVAGGRSRLHLIDLGGCANRNGGLPLSGIGNVLLAILSGQRHPPNKDHPLTPLLKDCLAPLTCHVAIMAHVMHTQSHTDALTTIQLASRIHRMRRRKHRFPLQADKTAAVLAATINGGHQSTGSSAGSGADPSSSELSADTVIYMGPSDEATDGEHPPVYLPSLSCGDNRGVMSKALKGSGIEKQQPQATAKITTIAKKPSAQKAPQSPVTTSRTGSLKRGHANSPTPQQQQQHAQPPPPSTTIATEQPQFFSPAHSLKTIPHSASSPKIVAGSLRHSGVALMSSKGSNAPSPKGSPLRRPGVGVTAVAEQQVAATNDCPGSPMRKITEEQWIDGPRVSRAKVAEARHLLREVNHVKQCETWIDGPKSQSSRSLTAGNLPSAASQVQGYGFMDSHKKTMIRQWVENQTSQVFQSSSAACSPTHQSRLEQQAQHIRSINYHMAQLKQKSLDATTDEFYMAATQTLQSHQLLADQQSLRSSQLELVNPIGAGLTTALSTTNASAPAEIRRHNALQNANASNHSHRDETDLHSERSLHTHSVGGYGTILHTLPVSDAAQQSERNQLDCDEDQDSGPSEVPPALPLIEPLGSREISHESLHRILSRHVSRESLYQQQQELRLQDDYQQQQQRTPSHHYSQHSMGMSDCGLQVTEEEIARTMGSEHPLSALSHCDNMSIVSSFNMAGDAFSDCAMGERTRNQFDQLARLREIFTSQLAMAEVIPVFRSGCDVGSVYSEPAYRFNTGPGSVCSEPPYRPPSPRQPSRSPSQGSLPSLNGIMQIAGMEQYASLRHPDGASDPNLPKLEKPFVLEHEDINEVDEKAALLSPTKRPSLEHDARATPPLKHLSTATLPITTQTQLPLLPLNTGNCEAYDSGHDSSTPRTSKHSGISRRAESGYHSVATARDSDESSFTSGLSKDHHNRITLQVQKKKRQDKGLCTWLMNPFTCTYPETEGEISDF